MTNLAYGDEVELKNLLSYKLDNGMSILSFVKSIFESSQPDLVMIDQIMFMLGNITGTS